MWELCYKCLLQIGLQKGSLASYSYHLCRPKSKCNLQLSLWAGPSPPPHFTILLFQNKGKKKRGKKGVFLQRCLQMSSSIWTCPIDLENFPVYIPAQTSKITLHRKKKQSTPRVYDTPKVCVPHLLLCVLIEFTKLWRWLESIIMKHNLNHLSACLCLWLTFLTTHIACWWNLSLVLFSALIAAARNNQVQENAFWMVMMHCQSPWSNEARRSCW